MNVVMRRYGPLLVLCGLSSVPDAAKAAPFQTGPCTQSATKTQLCSFADPEDMASLSGTPWILVSTAGTTPDSSGFAVIDTTNLHVTDIKHADIISPKPTPDADCLGAAPHFKLGGMGVRFEGGRWRLVVIEHADTGRDAVAFYDVDVAGALPHLTWTGCVLAPEPYFLNDVAALPRHGFAATHMFDRAIAKKDMAKQKQRFLAGEKTGFIVHWSPAAGFQKILNSEGTFPNGIDSSPDGKTLYMAETYGHKVSAIGVDGANRRSVALAMQPDNVTVTGQGDVIVAGGTGVPMVSTDGCAKFRPVGCGFPSAVVRVDFATSGVTTLFTDDGTTVPGASVGVLYEKKLYIGTSYGNRVTVVASPAQ